MTAQLEPEAHSHSDNGEIIWHHDARHRLNQERMRLPGRVGWHGLVSRSQGRWLRADAEPVEAALATPSRPSYGHSPPDATVVANRSNGQTSMPSSVLSERGPR